MSFATLVGAVATGKVFHSFSIVPSKSSAARDGLTARELEILQMVAAGASNVRIAKTLWLAEQTVKYHLSNIYRKLGVANRTQASHYAHVHGLFERPGYRPGRASGRRLNRRPVSGRAGRTPPAYSTVTVLARLRG